jgi:hypothetical protein
MALTKITGEGAGNLDELGIGTASPDTTMHIHTSSAGTVDAVSGGVLTLEKNNHAVLQFLTPNDKKAIIYFGDPDDIDVGRLEYDHSSNAMLFNANAAERMRLTSGGNLNIGKTADGIGTAGLALRGDVDVAQFTRSGGEALEINRLADDGNLVIFYQAGTAEGNISVSGTTVSYNGGHLARWSQATDGNRITGLVKGTVMTNLDQMAVWHHEAQSATYYEEGDELPEGVSVGDEKTSAFDAYNEDNEQLNCMAVSSVEGDANVAGVFVNYDDDDTDYTADMNIAMTGDMVIRIASGTTVARGDLLMSAGDGTAKPQGDDIVRSKTIAKVTSITVSHTYDDGSYLVPCVLMAC